jgi:hypothetical protein
MSGIQYQSMTNSELARTLQTVGAKNLSPEALEHVALRFAEIFYYGNARKDVSALRMEVTPVPFVAR